MAGVSALFEQVADCAERCGCGKPVDQCHVSIGKFGFPDLGLAGAGVASSIAHTASFVLLVVVIWTRAFPALKDVDSFYAKKG